MAKKPKKLLFTLILIGLLTAVSGCESVSDSESTGDASADTDIDADSDTDFDTDTNTDTDTGMDTDTDTDTQEDVCGGAEPLDVYEVPSPPEGTPANLGDICQEDGPSVTSNKAAMVSLDAFPENLFSAKGRIELAEGLKESVVGLPTLEITSGYPEEIVEATIENLEESGEGYDFDLHFPESTGLFPGETRITVKVIFNLLCDDDSDDASADAGDNVRQVESTTYLDWCSGLEHDNWVGSGGECVVCSQICEMAACPLPSSLDQSALSGSPDAQIVPVAGFGKSLVLFVEHRNTRGALSYSWKASAGSIVGENQSGVIWNLPAEPGPHLVQVAVKDENSAAVATLRWRHRA